MTKKLFTIHRNCYATIDITVAAENEEDAKKIAAQRFDTIPASQYYFDENEVSVIDSQDAPDVDDMMDKVKKMYVERGYQPGDAMVLDECVNVHVSVLESDESGHIAEMVEHLREVESIYVDEDGDIYVQYDDTDYDDDLLENFGDEDIIAVLEMALA